MINNSEQYKKALRLAKKQYQNHINMGKSPYLIALDDLLNDVDIVSEVNIGVIDIPLKKVIGTKTHSRSTSFAHNYMPLLKEGTEFESKWSALCKIHLKEGIRDPIKAYEYLNRYYVLEGNKRVSVLKYYQAVSIRAQVIRLIPKRNEESLQNKIYYEFLNFYKLTGINFIWFKREGSFSELIKIVNEEEKQWTIEEKQEFIQFYNRFRRMYKSLGGDQLDITTGDAFLEYTKVYGYEGANAQLDKTINQQLSRIWKELELIEKDEALEVLTDPEEQFKRGFLSSLLTSSMSKRKLKVAFVYASTIKNSSWTYGHELGRMHIQEAFGQQIITKYVENVPETREAYEAIEKLANEGMDIIFTTSPTFINPTLKAAMEYPNIKFLNCSENMSYSHLRTYYGRLYEAKFITGMISGILTQTDTIGYVADYPIPGVISSINAFTLGARFVNPNAEVILKWATDQRTDEEINALDEKFMKANVDIISNQDLLVPSSMSKAFGVYKLIKSEEGMMHRNLTMPIWHWGIFYEKLINSILSGSWKALSDNLASESKAINYWWGLNAGVVDVLCSNSQIPDDSKKIIDFMKKMIMCGEFHPFSGPIYDQNKKLRVEEKQTLSNDEILKMNWLVEHVIGDIPKINDDIPLLNIQGVLAE